MIQFKKSFFIVRSARYFFKRCCNQLCIFAQILFVMCLLNNTALALPVTTQVLNDSNTRISFTLDLNWNKLEGQTSGVSGKLWRTNQAGRSDIAAEILVPVYNLFNSSNVNTQLVNALLLSSSYREVLLKISGTEGGCLPEKVARVRTSCAGKLLGTLNVNKMSYPLYMPYTLKKTLGENGKVVGELAINSNQIAPTNPLMMYVKVAKQILIKYEVELMPLL